MPTVSGIVSVATRNVKKPFLYHDSQIPNESRYLAGILSPCKWFLLVCYALMYMLVVYMVAHPARGASK